MTTLYNPFGLGGVQQLAWEESCTAMAASIPAPLGIQPNDIARGTEIIQLAGVQVDVADECPEFVERVIKGETNAHAVLTGLLGKLCREGKLSKDGRLELAVALPVLVQTIGIAGGAISVGSDT